MSNPPINFEIFAASLEVAMPLFHGAFGEEPDSKRLSQARLFALKTDDGVPVAAVAVETNNNDSWHLWLLAVDESYQGLGFGRRLMEHVVSLARCERVGEVRIKTFLRWKNMQSILHEGGWYLCGAELAGRHDGVREIWRYPIVKEPIRLMIAGANPSGRGGEWLDRARTLPALFRITAVADPDVAVRAHWESQGISVFESLDNVPVTDFIDAAVIAVPPMYAATAQSRCIERGLPYLVEKPMAASLSELVQLQRLLQRSRKGMIIGVQRRSHPAYVALKSTLLDEDIQELSIRIALGRPLGDSPAGHRADRGQCRGGALLDLGYHALDLAHFLLGKPFEPVSCSLFAGSDIASGLESAARILGRCGTTWVRFDVDRHGLGKREEVRARTPEGVWIADRERVRGPDGTTFYQCPGSWEKAELGTLASLASIATTGRGWDSDLWEHLSLFETVERAYSSARLLGLEGFSV